ncbi:hypothetical protein L7F22_059253 [Adiantum nelumboides]|nr:hypothetical protein [Adiantum nelumboides]
MPPSKNYLPYVKADKAFKQEGQSEQVECESVSSSPALSEISSSSNSDENLKAAVSPSQNVSWQKTILSPAQAFQVLKQSKEDLSLRTPSTPPNSTRIEGFNLPLLGQVKWEDLKKAAKDWIKDSKNLALCLWGLAVGISGAILFLVMVGLLDKQLPSKKERDAWFEVNNQILNALFTMMCLYLHPQRCLHLVMLLRWHPQDISKLRQVYCKNGTYKPHEWVHMLAVVVLLHINCFAQYALCGLNWGFKRSQRPPVGVGLCLAVAIGAPAAAGIYSIVSPLGKDFYVDEGNDINMQEATMSHKLKLGHTPSIRIGRAPQFCCGNLSFASRDGALVNEPHWQGGLLNCCEDPPVAVLSTVCAFCVFGWNMERLGLGNRYVHTATFILICTAPYWILTLAAINIDNVHVRKGLGVSGIMLSIFGLMYGGFWRIQMRRTYGLPVSRWCLGKPVLTDCVQWLFCPLCSLCQEVRTSEHYRVKESNFYERRALSEVSSAPSLSDRQSSRSFHFGTEASSPVPYRAYSPSQRTYLPTPFSFSPEIMAEVAGSIEAIEDGNSKPFTDIASRSPMLPPVLQAMEERSNNHHSLRSIPYMDSQNYAEGDLSSDNAKFQKGSQQTGGSMGISNGDHVLLDRSNRL